MAEPTAAELWRGVETTIVTALLPAITDEWARAAAIQLVGIARYAAHRPADQTEVRADELADVLDGLALNPIVSSTWNGDRGDLANVFAAVGSALAAAVVSDGVAAQQIRDDLRPVVVRQLDDELAITGPLVASFRGQLDA